MSIFLCAAQNGAGQECYLRGFPAGRTCRASSILDRFLHHAQTIAITGRSYRLKDHATVGGKEDKTKKIKSKPNEPSTAEPAS
jgi:hypothetical protein